MNNQTTNLLDSIAKLQEIQRLQKRYNQQNPDCFSQAHFFQ